MTRWNPGARDRLRHAALDLYLERGFENVTATEIAERAGLARRTFFRYFADTREALFAGSEQLPPAVTAAVRGADETLSPIRTVLNALAIVGEQLVEHAERPRERRDVIASSPDLQERERTKLAAISLALADGLSERGVERASAQLLAEVATATFQGAFTRWIDEDGHVGFQECFAQATDTLRTAFAPGR